MAITPQTDIRLLKVPFELDNKNQLTFANKTAQTNYFLSLPYLEYDDTSYQRKDSIIHFYEHIDKIINYNYVMYKNENYSDKWFYAFITNMEYKNDSLTDISIKTDTFQTWQFDLEYKQMFVEREHVNDDTIGLHTVPENLDIGEIIEEEEDTDASLSGENYYVGLLSSWDVDTEKQYEGISLYNKQVFGKQLFLFDFNQLNYEGARDLLKFIVKTNIDGHIDDIGEMFIIPSGLIPVSELILHTYTYSSQENGKFYTLPYSNSITDFNINITKTYSFSNFSPRNNKCYVYPFNYLLVSNNVGNKNIYKYEEFSNTTARFKIEGSISVGCSGRCSPVNYKGQTKAIDDSIPLGKYPTCAWSSDAYTNWLTQNAINIPFKALGTAGSIGVGIATTLLTGGNVALGATVAGLGLATQIGQTIGEFREASLQSNIEGGQNTGDVNFGANDNSFIFRHMRAKTEYLKIIDDFFTMYGYKVNTLKIPNITGRSNWNYVKTINANILGDIPQEDLQEIKTMFDTGVTFWHNPSNFLNYSANNSII